MFYAALIPSVGFTICTFFYLLFADKELIYLDELNIKRSKFVTIKRFEFLFLYHSKDENVVTKIVFVYTILFYLLTTSAMALLILHFATEIGSLFAASVILFSANMLISLRIVLWTGNIHPEQQNFRIDNARLNFLVKEYGLKILCQEFKKTHYKYTRSTFTLSYYNENGCFTINRKYLSRVGFYYAERFSNRLEELCQSEIDIKSIGHELWAEAERKYLSKHREGLMMQTLAESIKLEIEQSGQFFGIKVNRIPSE